MRSRRSRGSRAQGGSGGGPNKMMVMFGTIVMVFMTGTYLGSALVPYYSDDNSHLDIIRGGMKDRTGVMLRGMAARLENFADELHVNAPVPPDHHVPAEEIPHVTSSRGHNDPQPPVHVRMEEEDSTSVDKSSTPTFSTSVAATPSKSSPQAQSTAQTVAQQSIEASPVPRPKHLQSLQLKGLELERCLMERPYDWKDLTVSVWIYLKSNERPFSIQTIMSNRDSGCVSDLQHKGYTLYVNNWDTQDHKLVLEYNTVASICKKMESRIATPFDEWVHAAFSFSQDGGVRLYMNGELVASDERGDNHLVQVSQSMRIGSYTDGAFAYKGNISDISFWTTPLDHAAVQYLSAKGPLWSRSNDPLPKREARFLLSDKFSDGKTSFQSSFGNEKITTVGMYSSKKGGSATSNFGSSSTSTNFVEVGSPNSLVNGLEGRTNIMSQEQSDKLGRERAIKVKEAMQFVWGNYRKHAWGRDELLPASGRGQDNWGALGVTLVDSLDTLWVMGMKDEFDEASLWVKEKLDFSRTGQVSFFETTIRELGGLLSAHSLSKEKHFLDKAIILGDKLLPAFGSKSGIPYGQVNLRTGSKSNAGWTRGSILAEIGTVQLEFRYLSEHSGNPKYAKAANKVHEVMSTIPGKVDGLCPIFVNPESAQFSGNQITLGALGDSYYEYLLKTWIQGGRKETYVRNMYDESVDGMMKHLLQQSNPNRLSYFADYDKGSINRKMDHLACFTAGMLALGSYKQPESERSKRDMEVAKALMYTCFQMYDRYDSGLSPEFVTFSGKNDFQPTSAPFYILRPETAESLFILHWITKDPIYREWGWKIFDAINTECRTTYGFGNIHDVRKAGTRAEDRMESFFLGETLKYLYLLQDPEQPISLDEYVFNTEAHPLHVFDSSR